MRSVGSLSMLGVGQDAMKIYYLGRSGVVQIRPLAESFLDKDMAYTKAQRSERAWHIP